MIQENIPDGALVFLIPLPTDNNEYLLYGQKLLKMNLLSSNHTQSYSTQSLVPLKWRLNFSSTIKNTHKTVNEDLERINFLKET